MRIRRLLVVGALVAGLQACGDDDSANPSETPVSTSAPIATTTVPPTSGDAEATEVPHRVLADGLDVGAPWTTRNVSSDGELEEIFRAFPLESGQIDWQREVVFVFTLAESGSCPFGDLQGLRFSEPHLRLYPVVELAGDFEACTADANPHTVVVSVDRTDLPEGDFSLWVEAEDPPVGVRDGVTYVAAGELTAPPSEPGEPAPLGSNGDLPVGAARVAHDVSTHCGLERIFWTIDGRQWVLADDEATGVDFVPPQWRDLVERERIHLVIEHPAPDLLRVTPVGSDHTELYAPAPDIQGCD